MRQVPLSGRVIFSGWHGVLSRDPFWVSIRGSTAHPLHAHGRVRLPGGRWAAAEPAWLACISGSGTHR